MGATARQFKALAKKNLINWKRRPCCSICEVICPALLMLLLVAIRGLIDKAIGEVISDDDNFFDSLTKLSTVFHPGYWWDGSEWVIYEKKADRSEGENLIVTKIDASL